MNKKLLVLVIVVSAALFTAGGILAKAVPDMIKLQDPAYKEHKKGVVEFTHGKHQKEYAEKYPEFYKNGCGECHHDKDNKPLSNLKEGDDVQKCIECHKIAAEAPKGKKAKKKLSKKEKIKNTSRPKKRRQPAPSAIRKRQNKPNEIIHPKGHASKKMHALFFSSRSFSIQLLPTRVRRRSRYIQSVWRCKDRSNHSVHEAGNRIGPPRRWDRFVP
jgi:hypothetical protein